MFLHQNIRIWVLREVDGVGGTETKSASDFPKAHCVPWLYREQR